MTPRISKRPPRPSLAVIVIAVAAMLAFVVPACGSSSNPSPGGAACKMCEVASKGAFECVPLTDRDFGCASPSCIPCVLPHANPMCASDGQCAVGACFAGFVDF